MSKKNNKYDGGYEEHLEDLSDWYWEEGCSFFNKGQDKKKQDIEHKDGEKN